MAPTQSKAERKSPTGAGKPKMIEAANVVAETRAGGAKEGWEQRRQIHGEKPKHAAEEPADRQPKPSERGKLTGHDEGSDHGRTETEERRGDGPTVTEFLGQPAGAEVPQYRGDVKGEVGGRYELGNLRGRSAGIDENLAAMVRLPKSLLSASCS